MATTTDVIGRRMEQGGKNVWKGLTGIASGLLGLTQMVDATAMTVGAMTIQAIAHLPAGPLLSIAGTVAAARSNYGYLEAIADVNHIAQNPALSRIVGYSVLALAGVVLYNYS